MFERELHSPAIAPLLSTFVLLFPHQNVRNWTRAKSSRPPSRNGRPSLLYLFCFSPTRIQPSIYPSTLYLPQTLVPSLSLSLFLLHPSSAFFVRLPLSRYEQPTADKWLFTHFAGGFAPAPTPLLFAINNNSAGTGIKITHSRSATTFSSTERNAFTGIIVKATPQFADSTTFGYFQFSLQFSLWG